MKEFKCEECNKIFGSEESLSMHNQAKHSVEVKKPKISTEKKKSVKTWTIAILVIAGIIFGVYFFISNIETLPPTSMQGHVEQSPPSHISRAPFPIAIQKHMIEHSDGTGRPGVIINYNCINFNCDSDLINNLEEFAQSYGHVYVAPFPKMSKKIVLTGLGRIETFDEYNEQAIDNFINGR